MKLGTIMTSLFFMTIVASQLFSGFEEISCGDEAAFEEELVLQCTYENYRGPKTCEVFTRQDRDDTTHTDADR